MVIGSRKICGRCRVFCSGWRKDAGCAGCRHNKKQSDQAGNSMGCFYRRVQLIIAAGLWPPLHRKGQPECGNRIVALIRDARNDMDHHFDPLIRCRSPGDKMRNFISLVAAEIHVTFGTLMKLSAEVSENQGYVFRLLFYQMHGQRSDRTVCANTERTKVHRSEMVPGSSDQRNSDHHPLVRNLRDRRPDVKHHGNPGQPEQSQTQRGLCFFGE